MGRYRRTLADLFLAFRQAKTAVAAERDGVGIVRFSRFELDLERNLRDLQNRTRGRRWFDEIEIGSVVASPRGIEGSREREDGIVRIGRHPRSPIDLTVRLQLEPTPEFSLVEVLYLWEFGSAIESLLGEECVGYRLKRVQSDGQMDRYERQVYEHWPTAFGKYRDEPIEAAQELLANDVPVTIVSTDVTSFFDSVDPAFMLQPAFVSRVSKAAKALGRAFESREYIPATESILRCYGQFRDKRAQLLTQPDPGGVPIGSLVSRLVANVALAGLDRAIQYHPAVRSYRRYVDDIVIVASPSDFGERATILRRLFPGYRMAERDNADDSFVVPETGAVFQLKKNKTRIHVLEGRAGGDFLRAVQASFSAVASERRAFISDVERLATGIEGLDLFEDGSEGRNRIPRLRDADRYSLRRFIAQGIVFSLERQVLLLAPEEAASEFGRHLGRLLAIVDADLQANDFDFVCSLLRIAVLSGSPVHIREVLAWLQQWIGDLSRAKRVSWKGQQLREGAIREVQNFLERRIEDAITAACPLREPLLWAETIRAAARDRYRTDLRYLSRPVDRARTGGTEVDEELPKGPGVRKALMRDQGLGARLKRAEAFLGKADALGDDGWRGLDAAGLLLSVKPPSYTDVARLLLFDVEELSPPVDGADIDAIVDALRGTRYGRRSPKIRGEVRGDTVVLSLGRASETSSVRVVLGSLPVGIGSFNAAVAGSPDLSRARMIALDKVLREAREARWGVQGESLRTLLVLPELAIPRQWIGYVERHAVVQSTPVVFGVEYDPRAGIVSNEARGVFPLGYRTAAVTRWLKRHPAEHEASALTAARVGFFGPAAGGRRLVVDCPHGRFGVLICSELLEASAIEVLTGQVEMVIVPAWNDDTGSFEHMAHAVATALVHAFVCVANNAEASDSRVVAPVTSPRHLREWSRLIQRGESRVVWADLPVGELRAFHNTHWRNGALGPPVPAPLQARPVVFRPLPPDWPQRTRGK